MFLSLRFRVSVELWMNLSDDFIMESLWLSLYGPGSRASDSDDLVFGPCSWV